MANQWETYAEAAERLGMTVEALRHRARRGHWRRQPGNDGRTRISVPADIEPAVHADAPPAAEGTNSRPPEVQPADQSGEVKALQARIEDLAAALSHAREETEAARRDAVRERDERRQERDRADRLTSELTEMAMKMAEAAAARDQTTDRITALESEIASLNGRSVWRRLVG